MMGTAQDKPAGPDLGEGVPLGDVPDDGMLAGHVGGDAVLLARRGDQLHAIGATCSHYSGPLAEGLVVGETVRCPWHHARFCLRTGEALGAPALNPVPCWRVEQRDGKVFVREKIEAPAKRKTPATKPDRIVILGGGAAGFAAAEMLRREGFSGSLTMLSSDDSPPCDRPNLSKDYLAGSAPEDWIPLRPPEFYRDAQIDLQLRTEVAAIDAKSREVKLAGGRSIRFDKLLLATGAEPVRLSIPGANEPHVHVLRSLADSRAIIAATKDARRAVVIGASFIGLEVAASLRARKLEVHVVAPERVVMERVLGPQFGAFVKKLHEEHGVVFHLEDTASAIEKKRVVLKSGKSLDADLVVAGVGVKPRIELAERAGLKIDRGVAVDEYLRTSAPDVFAAGDIARWPDPHSGAPIRTEHWVVAERHGQAAARNMLGAKERFADVPFFWSQHYDVPINYIGHAEKWDAIEIDGDIDARDCLARYRRDGKVLAVASIYRDLASLKVEAEWEAGARSA
jgi:NADPH-dependent 2,4-dienoyl-CoA reductase/sulfur reductase-like enzyme/nitrite reductase/ring-hydroxylating ferredoxin subunit